MIPNRYSPIPPKGGLNEVQRRGLQRNVDAFPHSLVSAAQSGGGVWGKNAVDYLKLTPIEQHIETILKETGLEQRR